MSHSPEIFVFFIEFNSILSSFVSEHRTSTLFPAIVKIPKEFSGFDSHRFSIIKLAASI